jgi:SlyX protein
MPNATDIEDRITELESRISFQEMTLIEMSDALAQVRIESAKNAELLKQALGDMRTMRTMLNDDPGVEPPPPHY